MVRIYQVYSRLQNWKLGHDCTADGWVYTPPDTTQLDGWVASASAVCTGLYVPTSHASNKIRFNTLLNMQNQQPSRNV